MSVQYRKVKSVAKDVLPKGEKLRQIVLKTMASIAANVGATLGPGGLPVLIERQETGFPNIVTKDGVTVFRYLGFSNPFAHSIMETARDASVRTATEAGDGTTSATVLAEALVRKTDEFVINNPKVSPQKAVRVIENWYRTEAEPFLKSKAISVTEEIQRAVALCSSNGDVELTDAVMKCFEITGDEGNVTIVEAGGPSGYQIEQLKGYAVGTGYEESCRRFYPAFVNDKSNNRTIMKNPVFVLYYGNITDISSLIPLMDSIDAQHQADNSRSRDVVVCALSFSEGVLGSLAANFQEPGTLNVFPLVIPVNAVHNSQLHFLQDLQAVTGADILDPMTRSLERATAANVGQPLEYFESLRYRSNIVGQTDESLLMARIEELKVQLQNPESIYEKTMLEERVAKLTGGIARLTVVGPSAAEIREKKDRADDAVCGIRGALKHGAIPGGGWGFFQLAKTVKRVSEKKSWNPFKKLPPAESLERKIKSEIIYPALLAPIRLLMTNCGLSDEEIEANLAQMAKNPEDPTKAIVWDGTCDKFVKPVESGIVDSLPAVNEALRNSISIATLLGTLGGAIVFQRDAQVERENSSDSYHYLATSNQRDQEIA